MVAVEAPRSANCIHLNASRVTAVTMLVDLLDHFSCRHKPAFSMSNVNIWSLYATFSRFRLLIKRDIAISKKMETERYGLNEAGATIISVSM
uniref:Uncharacterized protein n=1 Tax=Trichuris muris TaxID=70415 RepID=A0A5S6R1L9_TRIMR